MMEESQAVFARTTNLSSGGFVDVNGSGSNFVSKPMLSGSKIPSGSSVTAIKLGRSIIVIGQGGYASANDGE